MSSFCSNDLNPFTTSLVDPVWEMLDPSPDIWNLFSQFDARFFKGVLTSHFVELKWSSNRMTSTAGLCSWSPRTNFAVIKLSKPLLTLRSRGDLVETLLHEMIHAYLFVTREDDNHESHGPKFHYHMYRINKEGGTHISVYHTFHDEVRHYQKHVWRCSGPCAQRSPYYGYVHRASNRPPGPYDYWWSRHQSECNGSFVKISEPEKPSSSSTNKQKSIAAPNNHKIDEYFFKSPTKPSIIPSSSDPTQKVTNSNSSPNSPNDIRNFFSPIQKGTPVSFVPFTGEGHRLGSSADTNNPTNLSRFFTGPGHRLGSSEKDSRPNSSRNLDGYFRMSNANNSLKSQPSKPTTVIEKVQDKSPIEITID